MTTNSAVKPSLVSVVIPAHNAAQLIGGQLQALSRQTYTGPVEVIVVDNLSTDDLASAVLAHESQLAVRIVPASDRPGVSHARNVGCSAAHGELIAICDADDIVEPEWLQELVLAAARTDIVGGRLDTVMLNSPETGRWRAVGSAPGLPSALRHLPYAYGSNVALWHHVFCATRGWDEELRGGGDDIDFAWRAQAAGYTLGYAPNAVVNYRLRESLWETTRQMSTYTAAHALLLKKHRVAGARPSRPARLGREVWWLVTRLPYLFMVRSWRCGRWLLRLASLWGRIKGSIRHRVWAI